MLTSGSHIGRYTVQRKLAEGGMAEIYLCTSSGPEGFEKEVVIKRIRSFLANDDTFIRMFVEEARLASRLNHANIVQIFDFSKDQDTYFIAMEYVKGPSLWHMRRRCRELGLSVPIVLAAEIAAQVARGLHHAHSLSEKGVRLNLVHRDVTPHNVLLSYEGAVKLTDFGIAKAGSSLTVPGMLKGKFAYMSPEQSRGEAVDARSDVFSLAIVLWEMITGGQLFEGDSDVAVLRSVQNSVILNPKRINTLVVDELDEIVMRALSRNVEERTATAADFERQLANFVLRHAQSSEDASTALFLRQIFREELQEMETAKEKGKSSVAQHPDVPLVSVALSVNSIVADSSVAIDPTQILDRSNQIQKLAMPSEAVTVRAPSRPLQESEAPVMVKPPARYSMAIGIGVVLSVTAVLFGAFWTKTLSVQAKPIEVAVVAKPQAIADAAIVDSEVAVVSEPSVQKSSEPVEAVKDASVATVPVRVVKKKPQLKIKAIPYASVYVDGSEKEECTGVCHVIFLEPGSHTISYKHNNRMTPAEQIVVRSGDVVNLVFDAAKSFPKKQ